MINNLEVFSRRNEHSERGRWYSAQGLGKILTARAPAKILKTEQFQTQSGRNLYNDRFAITNNSNKLKPSILR